MYMCACAKITSNNDGGGTGEMGGGGGVCEGGKGQSTCRPLYTASYSGTKGIISYAQHFRIWTISVLNNNDKFVYKAIDLFHNGGLLMYSVTCMIRSLSDLIWKKVFLCILHMLTRLERLIIIYIKEYVNKPPLWNRSMVSVQSCR